MEFTSSERDPWRADYLSQQLVVLGAERPNVSSQEATNLRNCYENPYRSYHGEQHGNFVGQPDVPAALAEQLSPAAREWAGAVLSVSGLWHDAVYKQVDTHPDSETGEGAWHPSVTQLIGDYAQYKRTVENDRPVFRTYLTEAGKQDHLTATVAHIFGFDQTSLQQGIVHNQGGNEFDSALAAAKFLEAKGTPAHMIVAVIASIAATIPFKPAQGDLMGSTPDGHMGELAQRVESVLRTSEHGAWQETNDIMLLATHLANRDISPFIVPDGFAEFINGGRKVKKEEIPELRSEVTNMEQLSRAAGIERSAPLLYQWISSGEGPIPAANIPHFYIMRNEHGVPQLAESYPPQTVYRQATLHAEQNTSLATLFFQAHEAGIVLAASLATAIGEPAAEVPGFVQAEVWSDQAEPIPQADAEFSEREIAIYLTLLHGIGQEEVDAATSLRSPIGGTLLGALGASGIRKLSEHIQQLRREQQTGGNPNAFSNPQAAEAMIGAIVSQVGMHNFALIVNELKHVAETVANKPERAAALERLLAQYRSTNP